jgi:hypothetical protein
MHRSPLLVLLLAWAGCASAPTLVPPGATLYANDSRMPDLKGSDLSGRVVVLAFVLPGFDEHRQLLASVDRVHRTFAGNEEVSVKAIAVSFGTAIHPEGKFIHDLGRYGVTVPAYWDRNAVVASAFHISVGRTTNTTRGPRDFPHARHPGARIRNMPLVVVLDREGRTVYRRPGGGVTPYHDEQLMAAVVRALAAP